MDSPYDWAKLDGTLMNNFASVDDYLSTGWAAYDADMINATKFVFTSTSANGGTFVFSSYDAEDVEGEYTIDANNDLDFKQPLNALISQSDYGWISKTELATTSENKLRLIKTQTDIFGNVTDMWLGKRDPEKAEYTAYHFVAGSESSTDPAGAIKKMLCAHEWKIDVQGTKFGGPLTYAEPVSFPELTSAWTPDIPSNTWLMIDGDHGSMKFNQNGTVDITQKTVAEGAFDQTNYISGAWTYDDITQNLTLDIPILHADNLTFAVRDWGDARIQSIGVDFLRLCVVRDPVLSGESEYYLIFNYVPAE